MGVLQGLCNHRYLEQNHLRLQVETGKERRVVHAGVDGAQSLQIQARTVQHGDSVGHAEVFRIGHPGEGLLVKRSRVRPLSRGRLLTTSQNELYSEVW